MATQSGGDKSLTPQLTFYSLLRDLWEVALGEAAWDFDFAWNLAVASATKANRFAASVGQMAEITYLAQTIAHDAAHGFDMRQARIDRPRTALQLEGRQPQSAADACRTVFLGSTSQLSMKEGKSAEELADLTHCTLDLMAYMLVSGQPWNFAHLEVAVSRLTG